MNKKTALWLAFATLAAVVAVIQFIPSPPLLIPTQLPEEQRDDHRLLAFEGIANFRDLGGYQTDDGLTVKWGALYRSGTLAHASDHDLKALQQLGLRSLIDFRSAAEKEVEPNRLPDPPGFEVIEIPTMDGGDNSVTDEIMGRIESGDFESFDPDGFMLEANRHFADIFTPQFREFLHAVVNAGGESIAWHCSAGKDRTGYAAAILLRILGVSESLVMQDYMLSKEYSLASRRKDLLLLRLFKGSEAADKLEVIMGVEPPWLQAGFDQIDNRWGSFDNYVKQGLQLSSDDILRLRESLLE